MFGPLAMMFLQRQQQQNTLPPQQPPMQPHWMDAPSFWGPQRQPEPSMPMRPPMQEGPAPPLDGPLAAMFRGRRG